MNLEELIYKCLSGSEGLTGHLATFDGRPAVFSPEAPEDNQEGWDGHVQYPRAVYAYDLQADGERKTAGTLSVSLLCQNTADVVPEDIEPEVKKCLRDVILTPEGGTPYCFAWARTDAFSIGEKTQDMTIGSDIRFDILEYPPQETTDPDPVMAVDRYVKGLFPECLVMGYDRMEETVEATGERPVIYSRLVSVDKAQETNTVAWMDGKIAIHILCPDSSTRDKMAAAIANRLSLDGEVVLFDGSPMFVKRLQADYKSDYLKEGQVFLTGRYGLLRYGPKRHILRQTHAQYIQGQKRR